MPGEAIGAADSPPSSEPAAQPKVDAVGDPLPEGALFRLGTTRFRAQLNIEELALSPDEKTVVTLGSGLISWDTATGKMRWSVTEADLGVRLPHGAYGAKSIAFAPDGQRFFTPGAARHIIVWDTLGGNREDLPIDAPPEGEIERALLTGREGGYRAIDVARDGARLALGSASGVVLITGDDAIAQQIGNYPTARLDANDGDRLRSGGHYSLAQFAPNGETLAVVTSDLPNQLRLVSTDDARELRRIALNDWLVRMAFSVDGKRLVATERDRAVRMYDVASSRRLWSHIVPFDDPAQNYTSAVAFSPDGKFVAACASNNRIYLLDAETGEEATVFDGHSEAPWSVAFTADSQTLYSAGWDGGIRRWSVATRTRLQPPVGNWASSITTASPDGRLLAYQDGWGPVHIRDLRTGAEVSTVSIPQARYGHLAFSPDSQLLAGGGGADSNVMVVIWDAASGAVSRRWEWPRNGTISTTVNSLAFSPEGDFVAAAVARKSTIYVWDVHADRSIAELPHTQVYGLDFASHGQLASVGWDRVMRFWDVRSGKLQREHDLAAAAPNDNELRMYAVRRIPGVDQCVTAHLQGAVRVWQTDNLAVRSQFQIANRFSWGAIAVSPDGLWIATGSGRGEVELWDAESGERVWNVGRHDGHVRSVAFGRDSQTVLTAGADGVAYQWDLRPADGAKGESVDALWKHLAGDDSQAAYRAIWQLCTMPEEAVELLSEKLGRVTTLVDDRRVDDGDSDEAKQQRQQLLEQLRANQPEVQSLLVFRRAIAVLAQLDAPAAKRLLQELAGRGNGSDVARLASAALSRLSQSK